MRILLFPTKSINFSPIAKSCCFYAALVIDKCRVSSSEKADHGPYPTFSRLDEFLSISSFQVFDYLDVKLYFEDFFSINLKVRMRTSNRSATVP